MKGVAVFAFASGCATHRVDESKLIDLTYPFNEQTVYWPTARRFELTRVAYGSDSAGRWYAANEFCAAEHGGTHLDAPIHFAEGRRTTAEIPLQQLIGPARVIDVTKACMADPDYRLTPEDVLGHERRFGRIQPGDAVLVRTGFGRLYPDASRYLGHDRRGVTEGLRFPGISEGAAQLLVTRQVDIVGLDTASLDHGPEREFPAHRVLAEANIVGLENVANLDRLPEHGALLIALPMKIEGGTGGPCRIVALLP